MVLRPTSVISVMVLCLTAIGLTEHASHGQAVIDTPVAIDGTTTNTAATLWEAIDLAVPGDTVRISVPDLVDTVDLPGGATVPEINFPSAAESRTISGITIQALNGVTTPPVAITSNNGDGTGDTNTVLTLTDDCTISGLGFVYFTTENPVDIQSASGTFTDCTFEACTAGAVAVTDTAATPLTFINCTFADCDTNSDGGGAIRVSGTLNGTLRLDGASITDCTASGAGSTGGGVGVVSAADSASVEIVDSTLSDNTAIAGGGAMHIGTVGDDFTLMIESTAGGGTTISNNGIASGSGGAIGVGTTGARAQLQISAQDSDVMIEGNGPIPALGAAVDSGGAIYIGDGGAVLSCTISAGGTGNVTLQSNSADTSSGGAIRLPNLEDGASIALNNTGTGALTCSANSAGGSGGAISVEDTGDNFQLSFSNADLQANTAGGGSGGALYFTSVGANSTITLDSVTFDQNIAQADGGALAIDTLGAATVVTIADVSITNNISVTGDGGGLYLGSMSDCTIDIGETGTANGSPTLSGNTAAGGSGGALAVGPASGALNLVALDGAVQTITLTGNSAGVDGGAMSVAAADGNVTLSGLFLNGMIGGSENTAGNDGGAVSVSGMTSGSVSISNCAFLGQVAGTDGGAISVKNVSDTMIMSVADLTATMCEATAGNGGAVALSGTPDSVTLTTSTLDNNDAGMDGGGLWLEVGDCTTVTIEDTLVTSNTAQQNGGGMALAGGDLVLVQSSLPLAGPLVKWSVDEVLDPAFQARVTGNTAVNGVGGGIVWEPSDLVCGGTLRGTAFRQGLRVDSIQVVNNSALGNGGGLWLDGGPAYVRNCGIAANIAGDAANLSNGGGAHVESGSVRFRNCRIGGSAIGSGNDDEGNVSFGVGGGVNISTESNAMAMLRACGICENTPDQISPTSVSGSLSPTAPAVVDDGINDFGLGGLGPCVEAGIVVVRTDGTGDFLDPAEAIEAVPLFGRRLIEVDPGTYVMNPGTADINSKDVIIVGEGDEPTETILQGGILGAAVAVRGTSEVWIECVSITGGVEDAGNGHHGGVYQSGDGTFLDLERCIIENNAGSGIVIDGGAAMTFRTGEMSLNTSAAEGGAIRVIDGAFTMTDVPVDSSNAGSNGGHMFFGQDSSGSLTDCSFNNGDAGASGGTAYVDTGASLSMTNVPVDDSTAVIDGGHMFFGQNSSGTMTDCDFSNSSAGRRGGAVFLDAGANPAFGGTGTFDTQSAGTTGGGVHCEPASLGSFSNYTFTDAIATAEGGGVWAGLNAQTEFQSCTFDQPQASAGGGMYLSDASLTVSDTDINAATVSGLIGCGLYILTTDALAQPQFTNGSVNNCNLVHDLSPNPTLGAGLYLEGAAGTLTMSNTAISGCTGAMYGGGAYVAGASPTLSTITSNCTATYYGAGTYIEQNSTVTMAGSQYISNTAQVRGGGIYLQPFASAQLNWTGGLMQSNAASRGGGLHVSDAASATITDVVFMNNTSSIHGAGIASFEDSEVSLDGCSLEGNFCPSGGAIYMWESMLTLQGGCSFTDNTASWGSAMYGHNSMVTASNCLFNGNISSYNGGAVYLKGGTHNFSKVAFNSNMSTGGDTDAMAIVGTADLSMLTMDNCYVANSPATAVTISNGVGGSYVDTVSCSVGTVVNNLGIAVSLGGDLELSVCTSEADLLGIVSGSLQDVDNNWVPDTELMGDLDGDGSVDRNDLILMIQSFNQAEAHTGDLDGNGNVDIIDLITLIRNWSN
ncbi:MAG: hypothetical protein MK101_02275 [Phycisphaerales bacterium]|nr:hypothetical protein [Phycisphaerales bacterium]